MNYDENGYEISTGDGDRAAPSGLTLVHKIGIAFGLLLLIGMAIPRGASTKVTNGSAAVEPAPTDRVTIEEQVAADELSQFEMVARNGRPAEICAHAGLVKAAYLQAHNEDKYGRWASIESACDFVLSSDLSSKEFRTVMVYIVANGGIPAKKKTR